MCSLNGSHAMDYDGQVIADASVSDLDAKRVNLFRGGLIETSQAVLMQELAMVREKGGLLRPTVAGVLLGTCEPKRWLPQAMIQAVAYRGESVLDAMYSENYQLDARDITGPLDVQIAEACHFVFRNQKVAAVKSAGRTDLPQYDMPAVFEAIVNAVAHRDYQMCGSRIRLRMFSDRLEIHTPGVLPGSMTVEDLADRQVSRNAIIANLLARCPVPNSSFITTEGETIMERRGEGVLLIMVRSEEHSGRCPVYEMLNELELRLTIYALSVERNGE